MEVLYVYGSGRLGKTYNSFTSSLAGGEGLQVNSMILRPLDLTSLAMIGACLPPEADSSITPSMLLMASSLPRYAPSSAKTASCVSKMIRPVAMALPLPTTSGRLNFARFGLGNFVLGSVNRSSAFKTHLSRSIKDFGSMPLIKSL